jgi:folate-binding protein YgfZ
MNTQFNAHFDSFGHFFFDDFTNEARLVLATQSVISPLMKNGLIRIRGVNAKTFLQGQLSCDVNPVSSSVSTFGAYCTIQGRVQAFFTLFLHDNDYFMLLPLSILPATLAELKKYGAFSKVAIDDVSDQFNTIGLYCKKDSSFYSVLSSDNSLKLFPTDANANTVNDNGIISIQPVAVVDKIISFIIVESGQSTSLWEKLCSLNATPVGDQAWQVVLIENGIPSIDEKTMNEFLPHSLNLPQLNAVHFKKGCYRGQEIVARMQYKGKIKKHLYRAVFSGTSLPQNGTLIVTEEKKEAGQFVNTVMISSDEGVCLAIIGDEIALENAMLYSHDGSVVIKEIKPFDLL